MHYYIVRWECTCGQATPTEHWNGVLPNTSKHCAGTVLVNADNHQNCADTLSRIFLWHCNFLLLCCLREIGLNSNFCKFHSGGGKFWVYPGEAQESAAVPIASTVRCRHLHKKALEYLEMAIAKVNCLFVRSVLQPPFSVLLCFVAVFLESALSCLGAALQNYRRVEQHITLTCLLFQVICTMPWPCQLCCGCTVTFQRHWHLLESSTFAIFFVGLCVCACVRACIGVPKVTAPPELPLWFVRVTQHLGHLEHV